VSSLRDQQQQQHGIAFIRYGHGEETIDEYGYQSEDDHRRWYKWIIVDEHHVQLLAERNGSGSGRVYTITITCTNEGGNTTQDVTVLVPLDQGH
jgi:hypothetical protein